MKTKSLVSNFVLPLSLSLALLGTAARSSAHFIWAQTVSGDPKQIHLEFSERPGDSILANFMGQDKKLQVLSEDTKVVSQEIKKDCLELRLKNATSTFVCHVKFGITDRGNSVSLLHYFPKAAANLGEAATPLGAPVEIVLETVGSDIRMKVLSEGKYVKSSAVVYSGEQEKVVEIAPEGTVITFDAAKTLAIRALVEEKKSGTEEGKTYSSIKRYATLTIGAMSTTKAVEKEKPKVADPVAYRMLEKTFYARESLPKNLKSITAKVAIRTDNKSYVGNFSFEVPRKAELTGLVGATEAESIEFKNKIGSMFMHRSGGDFAQGDGRHPLELAGDTNLIGTLIVVNDSMSSKYRVVDDVVTEVDRTMGGKRFVVTILDVIRTKSGKTLSHVFDTSYFNGPNEGLTRSDQYTDEYVEIQGIYLPKSRKITTVENGKFTSVIFEFSDYKITR